MLWFAFLIPNLLLRTWPHGLEFGWPPERPVDNFLSDSAPEVPSTFNLVPSLLKVARVPSCWS